MAFEKTPPRATVPKIFRGIPELPKFQYPGPIKKALKDINYIKELNAIPCAPASPEIYIKTAFNTAPPALLSLFLPGCTDIMKTKVGLSPWHLRGIKGMIQKASPPQALAARQFLYKVGYFAAEKYLWFFLVADVTKEFFITWQSQVFMAQQCQLPGTGTAHGYVAPFVYTAGHEGGLGIAPIKLVPGVAVGLNNVNILPGFQGSFGWSCEWDSWPIRGQGVSVTTWMTESGIDTPFDVSALPDPLGQQGNVTGGSVYGQNISLSQVKSFSLFMRNEGETPAQVVSGTWSVSAQGRHSGLSHFGCFPKVAEWPFPNPLG